MELTVIATTLALSMGLGLAAAHTMLSMVFFFMARSMVQSDVRSAMGSEPLALSVRAA